MYVVQNYLTRCKTNEQPPGLADFLRGTICLSILSKEYNFDLKVNTLSHPIYRFLKVPEEISFTDDDNSNPEKEDDFVEEFIPSWPRNKNYEEIYENLTDFLSKTTSKQPTTTIHILTNSFYKCLSDGGCLCNFGEAPEHSLDFVRKILTPSEEFKTYFESVVVREGLPSSCYEVIHFRFGDKFLLNPSETDQSVFNKAVEDIERIIVPSPETTKFIFICDSQKISEQIESHFSESSSSIHSNLYIRGRGCQKVHMGSCLIRSSRDDDDDRIDEGIKDTLVDLFLMIRSEKIWAYPSGFSKVVSILFKKSLELVP